jgi:hypothetical protein
MDLEERIKSFSALGEILGNVLHGKNTKFGEHLNFLIENQYRQNPWFTPENVRTALQSTALELTEENLVKWTSSYPGIKNSREPLKAAVIMAGNIPLVGFHDMISVLITGNNLIAKTSSKDSELIVYLGEILSSLNPEFRTKIEFTEGALTNFDVVIATGSNNTSRYFEYYFAKYPNIIRKNRNSIAILEGNETEEELEGLGKDIFSYFGLGCRNISKIYVPKGYDFTGMVKNWNRFSTIISHTKYANNYDFNKAVYIVNKEKFNDTGYLLIKEDRKISSPVSVLHYEYIESQEALKKHIELMNDNIQCIVGRNNISFGEAQSPHLWDYADGIDTIEFLLKK